MLPGVALDRPITEVMTPSPGVLDELANAQEALGVMAKRGYHQLVVTREDRIAGIVSERDLFSLQGVSMRNVMQSIRTARSVAALKRAAQDIGMLTENLIAQGAAAEGLTHTIAALNVAMTERVFDLMLHGAAAIDEFVTALRGKKLSSRQIEHLAHGFFRGPESFRQEIRQGHLTLPLQQLKDLPDDPDGCTEFERLFLADLEQAQNVLVRLMAKNSDERLSSRPFRAQAHLLCAGLLSRLPTFTLKNLQTLYDHCGHT